MKFLIITHVLHKQHNGQIGGYAPYVREMNIWLKYVDEVRVIAPISKANFDAIDIAYQHPKLHFVKIPTIQFTSISNIVISFLALPLIVYRMVLGMWWANHIHLRCPGNMGLLGSFMQILFPFKKKTAKYAGNWDKNSPQAFSYHIQRWILSNTLLTHNMQVLIYGEWQKQSRNIRSFFTASYSKAEIVDTQPRTLNHTNTIKLLFVGALAKGKNPLLSVQTAELLHKKNYKVQLFVIGQGAEQSSLREYVAANYLSSVVSFTGNINAEALKEYYRTSHFLVFMSDSEGWPKVVAEAMFWGCVPITTAVSCVPYMLGEQTRGTLVAKDTSQIEMAICNYLKNPKQYELCSQAAMHWSREFTLETFEQAIQTLL